MPADPETTAALGEIRASVDGLRDVVTQTNLNVERLSTTIEVQARAYVERFERVDRDREELKRDVAEDVETAKKGVHARLDRLERRVDRPAKVAGAAGAGFGVTILAGLAAFWEWLKSGGGR